MIPIPVLSKNLIIKEVINYEVLIRELFQKEEFEIIKESEIKYEVKKIKDDEINDYNLNENCEDLFILSVIISYSIYKNGNWEHEEYTLNKRYKNGLVCKVNEFIDENIQQELNHLLKVMRNNYKSNKELICSIILYEEITMKKSCYIWINENGFTIFINKTLEDVALVIPDLSGDIREISLDIHSQNNLSEIDLFFLLKKGHFHQSRKFKDIYLKEKNKIEDINQIIKNYKNIYES